MDEQEDGEDDGFEDFDDNNKKESDEPSVDWT